MRRGESCIVVTDGEREDIGEALHTVVAAIDGGAVICRYLPGDQHGQVPQASVAGALLESDVFVATTTRG